MGRIALTPETLDLHDAAMRTVETMRYAGRLEDRIVEVTGDHAQVEADAVRMEQVIANLLANAVRFTDRLGHIALEIEAARDTVRLRVIDDGIGIPAELLRNVFELFVQGSRPLDRSRGGLGIGLTLVRRLVELQGGTVSAVSAGEGMGSTFVIEFPRQVEAAPRPGGQRTVEKPGTPLRVLLVDDNEDVRAMLRVLLERQGHEVHEAPDGPMAVDTALWLRPDLALVDVGLPGFDGLEVARRLRADARTSDAMLVAISGYGQPRDRRRTAEAGFEEHLVKPIKTARLDEVLAAAARRVSANTVQRDTGGA
jgi:CheY-like chemotaxis protein